MDDILLLHQDRAHLELATLQIAIYLRSLGWTLSMEKGEFTPAQVVTFLGWRWDFERLTLSMTSAMRSTLLFTLDQWIRKALKGERVRSRALGSIIGCLNFLRCHIPRASLYLRTFAYIVGERGALEGVEWLYYSLEGDCLGATMVAAERLVQHAVRLSCKRFAGYINYRRLQNRLGSRARLWRPVVHFL
jgi:hypothetical protein